MPNNWENHYSLNPNVADPNLDSDGDGVTNYQEFRAGTDPKNASPSSPTSRFVISSIMRNTSATQIQFPSISGKTYRLEYRDDWITGSWLTLLDEIAGTGASVQVIDPSAAGVTKRFYRLAIEP